MPGYRVLKFGGSSVGSPDRLRQVTDLILRERLPLAVVVSAMGDTTDHLIAAATCAAAGDAAQAQALVNQIADLATTNGLVAVPGVRPHVAARVRELREPLEQLLHGVSLLRELTPQTLDLILSFGERLSASVLAELLEARGAPSLFVDARRWVVTDARFGDARVDWPATRDRLHALRPELEGKLAVHTGFLGMTADGRTTTLGRNGSDYTATLLARGLAAEEVTVWTDVSGVMTADPGIVADAYPLARMSYLEALELASFGARMFHPRTMIPLMEGGIPMCIKNTMSPDAAGTRIDGEPAGDGERPTCVTSLEDLAVLSLRYRLLAQDSHLGPRVLRALEAARVQVYLTTQSGHGQALAVVVPGAAVAAATNAIDRELAAELQAHEVEPLSVRAPVTLLTLVTEGMLHVENVAGRFFQSLGGIGVPIRAIAQGGSSRSISCVVDAEATQSAVRAVHTAFAFSHAEVSLLVLGKGVVGREVLAQLRAQGDALLRRHGVRVRVAGIADSKSVLLDESGRGVDLERWEGDLARAPATALPAALDRLRRLPVPVLVDCTALGGAETTYLEAFRRGVHVVSANKKPLAIPMAERDALMAAASRSHRAYHYETTVGASLPVIETLKNLVRTGDRVRLIEGSLSGTLGYLANRVMDGSLLSDAVRDARERGYTEPKPQDDLSGLDAARKALILARELGLPLELHAVRVEPLVPTALLAEDDLDAFFRALRDHDAEFGARADAQKKAGKTLRYLARVDPERGSLEVGPTWISAEHPATRLRGSEAFVAFATERYSDYPLIVQGAGAGGAVTAAGVLADVLRIAQTLRGR